MSNLPQSFQTPNEYVDYFCSRLTGAEFKVLIAATRKITGWPQHRATMSDNISLRQFQKLTGIKDRRTIVNAAIRLSKFGILKKNGGINQKGQSYRLIRLIKRPGQTDIFEEDRWSENSTTVVRKFHHSGQKIPPTKPNKKPNKKQKSVYVQQHQRTPMKKTLQTQLEMKFTEPKEVVNHLREIASNGSEEREAASIALMVLEQLWTWGFRDELLKSWRWFFYAAAMWPAIVKQAWGEVKSRKLEGEKMNKPGAILTLKIKELKNGNPKNQNHA